MNKNKNKDEIATKKLIVNKIIKLLKEDNEEYSRVNRLLRLFSEIIKSEVLLILNNKQSKVIEQNLFDNADYQMLFIKLLEEYKDE